MNRVWATLLTVTLATTLPSTGSSQPDKAGALPPSVQFPRPPSTATAAVATGAAAHKVLLVDDDDSDNNSNAASGKLSPSDAFYRQALADSGVGMDTFVVRRYEDGPPIERLKGYDAVVWYTGGSYGGNANNTAVISLKDEETLRQYVSAGGKAVVVSPGYLNNALGAGGVALWDKKDSKFLQEVLGIKGGRGLLQRFKAGSVTGNDGKSLSVAAGTAPLETQFSALNPETAQVLYSAQLDPDGKGTRTVPVASLEQVGAGQFAYVGFTLEAADQPAGKTALLALALGGSNPSGREAAGTPTALASPAQPSLPRTLRTTALVVTGVAMLSAARTALPLSVASATLAVSGVGQLVSTPALPLNANSAGLRISGIGTISAPPRTKLDLKPQVPVSVTSPGLAVSGIGTFAAPPVPVTVQSSILGVTGTGNLAEVPMNWPLSITAGSLQVTGTGAIQ